MELYQVRYFLALARTLSFSDAARECSVTQPAISKALRQLECEMGGDLIHREGRLTHLSDLGKLVLPTMQQTVTAADSVLDQARQYKEEKVGAIRIGLATSVSASIMAEPLSRLACSFPRLQIDLVERKGPHLADALLEGEIHAAIAGRSEKFPSRIDHWQLFDECYVALVSQDHPFAKLREIPVRALRDTVWLGREACEVRECFERTCFEGNALPRITHSGSSESHLQHLAVAGLGALLAPEHFPRLPGLVALSIEGDPVRRCVELLVVAGRRHTPVLRELMKLARHYKWQNCLSARRSGAFDNAERIGETPSAVASVMGGSGRHKEHRTPTEASYCRSLIHSAL